MKRNKNVVGGLLWVVVVVLCLRASVTPAEALSYSNSNGSWRLTWNITVINSERWIEGIMTASTTGWVAMGINSQQEMTGSDIIWGQILTNGTAVIVDRFAGGEFLPAKDAQQNVVLVPEWSNVVNGVTSLGFRRKLVTGDTTADLNILSNTQQVLVWAIGNAKGTWDPVSQDYTFAYHSSRGVANIVFDPAITTTPNPGTTTTTTTTPAPGTTTTTTTTLAPSTTTTTTRAPSTTTTTTRAPSTTTTTTPTPGTTTTTTTTRAPSTTTTTPAPGTTTTTTSAPSTTTTTTPAPPPIVIVTPTTPKSFTYSNDDGSWKLDWAVKIVDSESWLECTVTARTTGWVGMGIGRSEDMSGADIMWGQILSNGTAVIVDRYAYDRSQPAKDSQQDVFLIPEKSSAINGVTTLAFKRKFDTGDKSMDVPINGNSSQILLWAAGSDKGSYNAGSQDYSFNMHTSKGIARVFFGNGNVETVYEDTTYRKVHGILMTFAWALCAIVATFIARYLKTSQNQWFLAGYLWLHLHAAIQLLCVFANMIGFAIIVAWVADKEKEHFKETHQTIGLAIFISTFFQPILGVVTERLMRKDKEQRWIYKVLGRVHWIFGWGIIMLAVANSYFGFYLLCVNSMTVVSYSLMLGFSFFLFSAHELLRWVAPWGSYLGGFGFTFVFEEENEKLDAIEVKSEETTTTTSSSASSEESTPSSLSTTSEEDEYEEDTEDEDMDERKIKQKQELEGYPMEVIEDRFAKQERRAERRRQRTKSGIECKWERFLEGRRRKQPPLAIKITLWGIQIASMIAILLCWIVVAIGIGTTNIDDPSTAFTSTCSVGIFPPSSV